MASLLLNPQERRRFVDYCEQYAESSKLIAEQLEKLPPPVNTLAKAEKMKAMAYALVAIDLRSIEDTTIG